MFDSCRLMLEGIAAQLWRTKKTHKDTPDNRLSR
jgi:hypothetical protein